MSIAASRVVDEVFPRRDISIHCPICKKECIFEWVVFRKGERSISQRCLIHGHLRLTPMVPAYIERVKGESLLQFMADTIPTHCRGCSRQGICKLVEHGFVGGVELTLYQKGGNFIPPKVGDN